VRRRRIYRKRNHVVQPEREACGFTVRGGEENANRQAKEWLGRGIPGLALAVALDGKIVFSEGFGYADLEERVPVWPTTKYRIGSVSKPLTATALMELVEAGKVDLDSPVQKYVPSFPDKGAVVTVPMVAGHLGGIRHYQGDEFHIQRHYANVLEGLKIFENDPLVAPPGTKFSYSSYGYNLLSAVVESAAGERLSLLHAAAGFRAAGTGAHRAGSECSDSRTTLTLLRTSERWSGRERAVCRQHPQMGRRRIPVHRGRPDTFGSALLGPAS